MTDTSPGWTPRGQEFQQEEEGKRREAGERKTCLKERKTFHYIRDLSIREGQEEREGLRGEEKARQVSWEDGISQVLA